MKRFMAWALALLGSAVLAAEAQVALVKDGKAKAVIVLEQENPSTRKAGEELQDMLQQRTGAKLELLSAKDKIPAGMIPVYLGLSERTAKLGAEEKKIPYDGYFFKATPEYAVIAGRDNPQMDDPYAGHTFGNCNYELNYYAFGERGTLNGVYKSLEKYAGNRHYMPHELGDIVPRSPDFSLPVTQYIKAPAFAGRHFYGTHFKTVSPVFLRWFYRLCAGGRNDFTNHSYRRMLKYKDSHPEYFALIDGKRDFARLSAAEGTGNLCLTNRGGIKAFADYICDFFDKHPNCTSFPVFPPDGMVKICECPECSKLLSPQLGPYGKFSNAVFHHASEVAKEVAKKYPDKKIIGGSYGYFRVAPEMDLPPNLLVRACYDRHELLNKKMRDEVRNIIEGFSKKKVGLLVWTYALFNHVPPMRGLPIFYPSLLQENIRFNHRNGVQGEFCEATYCAGGGDTLVKRGQFALPGITHINDYVRQQLLWDPDLDMNAMLDEYYRLFYGPAAPEMKEFWTVAEKTFMKNGEAAMYSAEDLDRFTEIIGRAAKKCSPESVYGKRIELMRNEMAPFFKSMYAVRAKGRFFGVSFVNGEIPMDYDVNGVWKHAREYLLNSIDGKSVPKKDRTRLFAIANKKGLALHIVALEPEMNKLVTKAVKRDDAPAWMDDCYEIFLITRNRQENRQYIITAGGQIFDGKRGLIMEDYDWTWNGDLKLKQTKTPNSHITTVFIPWSDLNTNFDELPELMFQLFRRQTHGDQQKGDYQTLFIHLDRHFYSPEYFGRIEFLGPENRLQNSSFENVSEGKYPSNWTRKEVLCTDSPDTGKYCVRLNAVNKKDVMLSSDHISVQPDTDYSLTLRHRGSAGFVYVLFYDAKNKTVPEPGRQFFFVDTAPAWKTGVCQGRVPAGAVKCRVTLRNFDGGKMNGTCFDTLEFRGGRKFMKPNVNFKNGSFETTGPDNRPAFWEKHAVLSGDAADGKKALLVAAGKSAFVSCDKFKVSGGQDCLLKYCHKGSAGYIYIIFYDKTGKRMEKSGDAIPVGDSAEWTAGEVIAKVPADAVSCRIGLRNFKVTSGQGALFDKLEFNTEK